jgi:hypothetical protein
VLEPATRCTLQDLFRPPAGYKFDAGVLCAYSVSLRTLLSIPAALMVEAPEELERALSPANAAKLLAAVRKTFRRLLVFCEESRIHADHDLSPLVGYAEDVVREVRAPNRGAFHPKLWLLRFTTDGQRQPPALRLVILSRNLTKDASWDVCAVLDGTSAKPGAGAPTAVGNFLRALEGLSHRQLKPTRSRLLADLALQAARTYWTPPPPLSDPVFHISGLGSTWRPPLSDRLAVFSPFLDRHAVEKLASETKKAFFLVSRPTALDTAGDRVRADFADLFVLAAEPTLEPSGRDTTSRSTVMTTQDAALHAKLFIWDKGRRTRLALGSANATTPALGGANVEFMVEFDCTKAVRGGVRNFLESTELAKVLEPYRPNRAATPDPAESNDTRAARRALLDAKLLLRCTPGSDGVMLELVPAQPVAASIAARLPNLRFWPATLPRGHATPCLEALCAGVPAPFRAPVDITHVTGFIVFEADCTPQMEAFTLNLALEGLDEKARQSALTAYVLPTPEMFLDFVRMLLGDLRAMTNDPRGQEGDGGGFSGVARGTSAVLEALVKAAADDPERLSDVSLALEDLAGADQKIVPPAFRELWRDIQRACRLSIRPRA